MCFVKCSLSFLIDLQRAKFNLERNEEADLDKNPSWTEIDADVKNQSDNKSPVVVKDFLLKEVALKHHAQGNEDNINLVSEVGPVLKKIDTNTESNCQQSGEMVAETVLPEVTKFISKTLKHRRQSVEELSQNINESQKYLEKLNSKAKRLSCSENSEGIADELSRLKKLKEDLAAVEQSLKKRLRNEQNACDISGIENIPPQNIVRTELETRSTCRNSLLLHKENSDVTQSIQSGNCQSSVPDAWLPLDLSVKSVPTACISDSLPPCDKTFESSETVDVHLTPVITKKVADLKLSETTTFSGESKETVEKQLTCSESDEAKKQDDHCCGTTSKTLVSLTKPRSGDVVAPHLGGADLKIVSPVAEKKIPQTTSTCADGLDCDFVAPPIWTPLALRSAGALSLPRPSPETAKDSHAVSMVVDAGRCQSNDDSHRLLCAGSQSQSASCINQSAVDSEDGSRASRHLGFSDCMCMTHTSRCYLPASSHNSAAIPVLPKHQPAAHVLHKCGQAAPAGHNLQDSAKDGHADAEISPKHLHVSEQFAFDSSGAKPDTGAFCQPLFDTPDFLRSPSLHSNSSLSEKSSPVCQAEQFQGRPQTFQGHSCFQPRTAEKPVPGDSSKAETPDQSATSPRDRQISPVTRSSAQQRVIPPLSSEVGSLSLTGNLWRSRRPAAVVSPTTPALRSLTGRLQASQQVYLEMLLDEECALFTCCRRPEPTEDTRCPNPVARLLSEGDTMVSTLLDW